MFQSLFVFLFASQAAAAKTCSGYFYEGTNFNRDANNKIIPGLMKTYFSSTSKLVGRDSVTWVEWPYKAKSARYSYNCQENLTRKDISDCSKTDCPRWLQYYEGDEVEPCKILTDNPNVVGIEAAIMNRIENCVNTVIGFGVVINTAILVTIPPILAFGSLATWGATVNCRNRICKNGLVGELCIKKTFDCVPGGLRCCHSHIGNEPRQCKKNLFGNYKCK